METFTSSMNVKKCLHCGGERIVPRIHIRDTGEHSAGDLEIGIYGDPSAVLIKETRRARLRGALCCDCGYLHIFAVEGLEDIWDIYLREKDNWHLQQ